MIWVKGKYGKETAIRGESRRLSARTASGARQYTGIVCAPSLSGQKCARFSRLRPLRAPSCRFLAVSCGCRAEPASFTAKRSAPIGVNNSPLSKPQACVTLPSGNRRRQAQLFPIKQNGVLRPVVSAGGAATPRNSSQISKSQTCVDMGQGEIRQRNGDQGRKPATFRPYRVRCSAIHGYCLRALLVRTKMRSVFAAAPPAGTFLPFPCRILRVQGGARKFYREAVSADRRK